MRFTLAAVIVFFGGAIPVLSQTLSQGIPATSLGGDAAVSYHWVHTNTQPADCGCFGLNGGGISASFNLNPHWSVVAESDSEFATGGPGTGNSLTLVSYLGGARYMFRNQADHGAHKMQPFAQLLVGGAHAGGGIAGAGDHAFAFESRVGGGIDVPLSPRIALRIFQADYEATTFSNGINDHQNNLLLGAGVVFRWFRNQRRSLPTGIAKP